ncbi:MAG: carboxypeptidase-like regulatory domain-containing protein [Saprospiraceae bacterium]|nr:carboxypeptidase regulatory-like domain-containing protein [Saprospiraceae bacterium]MCB9342790.1 carboxypeptidase regulatory-like domain-containing protein [Lewinellaceae bacterium]
MNKLRLLLAVPVLLLLGVYACHKDPVVSGKNYVEITFVGQVLDENGLPLEGAHIMAGVESSTSDKNGVFRLKPVKLDEKNAILRISKIGYFNFSRAYIVDDGSMMNLRITLLKRVQVGSISSSSGGSINIPGGAKLSFPADAVAYATGPSYTGNVRVYARYLDPTDDELSNIMPGDLRAINAGGEDGVLSTFGMLGVEITDNAGSLLNIKAGSEVELRMPISAEQSAIAPDEIPLWYYDQQSARWIEEGAAQRVGNEYVGKVKHFSFWNCDAFSATVYMEGHVYWQSTQSPVENAQIRLTVLSNGFKGYGYTNTDGWFGGAIPKDYNLKLEVLIPGICNNLVLYSEDIGPFSSDVVLPDIFIDDQVLEAVQISGHLSACVGGPVENGYAKIEFNGIHHIAFTDNNGDFELNTLTCQTSQAGTVTGYDIVNIQESNPTDFSIPPNTLDIGDITVCNSLDEYIQYTLDGVPHLIVDANAAIFPDTIQGNMSVTYIDAVDSSQNRITLWINNDNQSGSFSINPFFVFPFDVDQNNSNLTATITSTAPNVGDLIIGTFGNSFVDLNGNTHNLTGSFKLVRDW